MIVVVIDFSVTVPRCFEDRSTAFTDRILEVVSPGSAVVPGLWAIEVANVLAVALRKKTLKAQTVPRFRVIPAGLPIRPEHHSQEQAPSRVLDHAEEHRLSAYGAAYLDVTLRLASPPATLDADLRRAAEQAGVVVQSEESRAFSVIDPLPASS